MASIKLITVEQSRQLERLANAGGLGYEQMMENAGRSTAEAISRLVALEGTPVTVLVGPGNNGGDGLVAAHYLAQCGADVACYLWKRDVASDPNYERVLRQGMAVWWAQDDEGCDELRKLVSSARVVVDALLGVGVSKPIGGSLKAIIHAVQDAVRGAEASEALLEPIPRLPGSRLPLIVAVDCPTGLDCDTGSLDESALAADVTVAFAHPKVGLLRFPGAQAVGQLVVADIGFPPGLADDFPLEMATAPLVRSWLPPRAQSAHKGTFGRALIVAGSANYTGAAVLAGGGAIRVGTGLVTMGLPLPIQPSVAAHLSEATYVLLPHDMGVLASGAAQVLHEDLEDYDAVLVGPGLTHEKETVSFVHAFLGLQAPERRARLGFVANAGTAAEERPALERLVIDADGLNALIQADRWWRALPPGTILTPHPGEMARLIGSSMSIGEVQADREGIASRMAKEWGAVIVLKGAFTVVASPDDRVVVLPFANAGLATAGTGDVLAGVIVGLRAQGLEAFEAATSGAYLHGLAGELVRAELGDMGMTAGDLLPRLPLALRRVRQVS